LPLYCSLNSFNCKPQMYLGSLTLLADVAFSGESDVDCSGLPVLPSESFFSTSVSGIFPTSV